VGAGHVGALAAREVVGRRTATSTCAASWTTTPTSRALLIYGLRVLGTTRDLPRLVREHAIQQVALDRGEDRPARHPPHRRALREGAVKLRIVRRFPEILEGKVNVSRSATWRSRTSSGRMPVQLDEKSVGNFLKGRVVMVTGAGGSIGSELARQARAHRALRPSSSWTARSSSSSTSSRSSSAPRRTCRSAARWPTVSDESRMRALFDEYRRRRPSTPPRTSTSR
jgi:FlaA1/EpsC-like NDP-sugar epimerase